MMVEKSVFRGRTGLIERIVDRTLDPVEEAVEVALQKLQAARQIPGGEGILTIKNVPTVDLERLAESVRARLAGDAALWARLGWRRITISVNGQARETVER
jgi:hypothetical protein